VSMDGKGRYQDNIFIERLWRSLKDDEVCLNLYDTMREVREDIGSDFEFFNDRRPHSALDYQSPAKFYEIMLQEVA